MSTRWHFRSNSPSSNTANRPMGPAPMITTSVSMGASLMISHLTSCNGWENVALICRNKRRNQPLAGITSQASQSVGVLGGQIVLDKGANRRGFAFQQLD